MQNPVWSQLMPLRLAIILASKAAFYTTRFLLPAYGLAAESRSAQWSCRRLPARSS